MTFQRSAIPRLGMVETAEAKLLARYGHISTQYKLMLDGKPIPPHVLALADQWKKTKLWEETPMAEEKQAPRCPTIAEVDTAVANLRALCGFAESHGGPKVTDELVAFARWTLYLNRHAESVDAQGGRDGA